MDRQERKSIVYLDLEAARDSLESANAGVGPFGEKLMALARGYGRPLSACAYGDINGEEAKELKRAGMEPKLTSEDGEGSAPESIAIALDAAEAAARGPAVEAILIVTDDAQLGELVRRLRRTGRYVGVLTPGVLAAQEPARSADHSWTIEALLAGEAVAEPPPMEDVRSSARDMARPRPPSGQTIDFATYDWTRLILLVRDLEAKMPFVGMRWLKNKVIGPHNVGAVTIADKQLLLNRAVEQGFIETYRVGNRDETGDPVTACKLVRTNERVRGILESNPAPPVVPQPAVVAEPVT
jgi:hypothetical protein